MSDITTLAIISLAIGISCTYLLSVNERQAFIERQTYKIVSIISFIFNITGSFLCMFMLAGGK